MSEPSPMMPAYQPYWSPHSDLNTLQHQTIVSTVNDNGRTIMRDISSLGGEVAQSTSKVVDTIGAQSLGLRDAIERNALSLATGATNAAGVAAAAARDIQVAIERNGLTGTSVTERVGSGLMSSVERTAGETRLANAVADAASRQAINDLARDITASGVKGTTDVLKSLADDRYTSAISAAATQQASNDLTRDVLNNMNRSTNELLKSGTDGFTGLAVAVERNGNATREMVTTNGYETRTLVNDRANSQMLEQHRGFDRIHGQASAQYSALMLEQNRGFNIIGKDMADAKYEALKNKEALSAQLAAASAESKYEALKNTQTLSAQLAECCCEIKMKVSDVSTKVDDTVRTLDSNRIRDSLNVANNEINIQVV